MKELAVRIEEIMLSSGLDKKSFAEKLNISAATLSHISSGRNNPSLDLVMSLLQTFQEISPDWLLFGRGNKLREGQEKQTKEDTVKEREEELSSRIKLLKMLKTEHYRTEMTLLDELRKRKE